MADDTVTFDGFEEPTANFTRIPNAFLEAMSIIDTVGEMKVVYYILRHTWGFRDDCKKITLDEFQYGRKYKDGTRLDDGTGLTKPTIIDGLARAEEHGFIEVEVDGRDAARIRKSYSLRMKSGVKNLYICGKETLQPGKETLHRTEKETPERHYQEVAASPPPVPLEESETEDNSLYGIALEEIYYRDKAKVTTSGRVYDPPWYTECPACGGEIKVSTLDKVTECQCALGAVNLLSKKKEAVILIPEPLLIYQRLIGRKVPPAWQEEVVRVVGNNTERWHDVIRAYVGMGWNSGNVANMLKYFTEEGLPGTRKQKEEEYVNPSSKFRSPEEVEAELRSKREPEVHGDLPLPPGYREPQAAIDMRKELERQASGVAPPSGDEGFVDMVALRKELERLVNGNAR